MTDIAASEARWLWDYDPDSGILRWKVRPHTHSRMRPGDVAGALTSDGYLDVMFKRKHYKVHRLAWLITHGTFPSEAIDHVNGIKDDNRLINLRCVSHRLNDQNRNRHRDGYLLGATRDDRRRKNPWEARIRINGEQKSLGRFPAEKLAHEAYMQAYLAL